ncbi:MAG: hypothetical protein AAF939_10555 [Planctomycetota bacterium]
MKNSTFRIPVLIPFLLKGVAVLLVLISSDLIAQPGSTELDLKSPKELKSPKVSLQESQKSLAQEYRLFEEKLFTLFEYEKKQNPTRAKLLKQAFQMSQEKMTASQLEQIALSLNDSKFKAAEKNQAQVLTNLSELLYLLQTEDRGSRVRDRIKRFQQYLSDVDRLLRNQKSVRGQAERKEPIPSLVPSQIKILERTVQLSDEMQNEAAESPNRINDSLPEKKSSEDPGQQGKPAPDSPNDSKIQDSQSAGQDNSETINPIAQNLQRAVDRMRQAQRELEMAKVKNAVSRMQQAEEKLAAAKRDLEEILRQLREEKIERTLEKLESRFRVILEKQVRVLESTNKLNRIGRSQRGPQFEIQCGKLSKQQDEIQSDLNRAYLLLIEDGSSVAFPSTVEEVQKDMIQVSNRLQRARIDELTIELQNSIVQTLKFLIDSLVQSQVDREKMKQAQSSQQGQPGEQPLVQQIAELKMIRELQNRIFVRHQRYNALLGDPLDPVGFATEKDLQAALNRLSDKQLKLTNITRDIVLESAK